MHLTTMVISNFYDAIHFWCCDVLFFNLQATSATEWKCNSSITTCHHNNCPLIVLTESRAEGLLKTNSLILCSVVVFFNDCQTMDVKKGTCQLSFWSSINHKFSWSSLAQRSESTSCTLRDGSSLGEPPRLVLEDEIPAFPTPASGFFGLLASPTSRNSKNRLTRLWPNQDSEPFLRFRATSNMVSSRLKQQVQEVQWVWYAILMMQKVIHSQCRVPNPKYQFPLGPPSGQTQLLSLPQNNEALAVSRFHTAY